MKKIQYYLIRKLLHAYLFLGLISTCYASGDQNITIGSTPTATTGTWTVSGSAVPYTYVFQPNAATDITSLNAADIVACLMGTNTTLGGGGTPPNTNNKPGNVTILTASTGVGMGIGNVTMSQSITALLSNYTQLTLTITAAGSINVARPISLLGASIAASAAGDGYPGANVILNSGKGISLSLRTNLGEEDSDWGEPVDASWTVPRVDPGWSTPLGSGAHIETDGGTGGGLGGNGGRAGAITMTATTGITSLNIACSALGGAGGSGGGAGGVGGDLLLTATVGEAKLASPFDNTGGVGTVSGSGGNGGNVTINGLDRATLGASWNSSGGAAGLNGGNGGNGGTLSLLASAGVALVNNNVSNYGGTGFNGNGGNSGGVVLNGFTTDLAVSCNSYGGNGGGVGNGGNGGALTMSAPAGDIILRNNFNSNGGAAGTSGVGGNGGAWMLTGLSTVSVTVTCSSNGGDGGTSGGNGGNGGAMSFVSSASNVSMSNMLSAIGGNGKAGNSSGGNGGNVVINSATSFKSSNGNRINTSGGNAAGAGSSGNGGNINLSGNAANGGLGLSETYTTSPGIVGSGSVGTAGMLTVSTGNAIVTSSGANDGQSSGSAPTILIGSAAFLKNGSGTFLLGSQNNSYTGLTTVNSGTLKLGANNVLGANTSGTVVNNGASIDINNVKYTTTEPLSLAGTGVSNLGAMTSGMGTAGSWSGVITISGGTSVGAAASAAISISGQITGSGSLTKVDYGTLSLLSASNNYTGSTTITNGVLQIAASEVIPNGSAIVLNGGTLRTNGAFSETMGALTVNAGSFVTFGSISAHTLTFANSNAIAWATEANITVSGWIGAYGAGTAGTTKFIVGNAGNALTATQLAKIQFVDPSGIYWTAQMLSTGEIVPSTSASGDTFYAIANGNWNTNTTWSYVPGGAAVPSGVFPVSTKNVVINGYTVTLNAAAACNNITLGSSVCGLTLAANDLTLLGNLSITACPTISTTGGNIIFNGIINSYQTITSTCANPLLGNVALINGANVIATNTNITILVANFTNTSVISPSSWINNTSTTLTVTGALVAPACNFISNGASGYNFSGATNSSIKVGGLTSNSSGAVINLGAKNTAISGLLSYTAGTLTSTGVISMAANSVVTAKDALTIANLQLGDEGITSTGGGTLTVTLFDFNGQTSFTQTAGVITTPVINNNTGPMSMAYTGTPTFIYSGSGVIPSGSYYNLTTTTNTKSVTCSSTITVDGVLTNSSGTIVGPSTPGQFGRFVNAKAVNNIGGTIGSSNTNLSFSGLIKGGTIVGNGTNVLQNSTQNASCTFYTLSASALTGYLYCQGAGPSASKSFTLSSSGLTGTGNVVVTGSTNYEVSSDNITFGPSANYPFAGSVIMGQPKTVYVRLKVGLAGGGYNGELVTVNAAGGAAAKTVSNDGSVVAGCGRTWTGNTNTDWHTNTNWTPTAVPMYIDDVIIPNVTNKPVIVSGATGEARAITIDPGASLTINATGTLNIYGSILNNGNFIASNGSKVALRGNTTQIITGVSVLYNTTVANTAGVAIASGASSAIALKGTLLLTSGALTTNSNLTVDIDNGGNIGYAAGDAGTVKDSVKIFRAINSITTHYISCPLNGVTATDLADDAEVINPATNKTRLFQYDNTALVWTGVDDLNTLMAPSTPFSMWFPEVTSVDYTGTYNHAASYTYTGTNRASQFMFLPNPYPCTLDWEAPGWTKTGIKNAIYFWDPATNLYASYVSGQGTNSATQFIPAMNSFFVEYDGNANLPTATIGMTNSIRSTVYEEAWLVAPGESVRLILENSSGATDETIVRFNENATNQFDNDLDAYKFMGGSSVPGIYTKIDTTHYSINSLSDLYAKDTIPVFTYIPADGDYVLHIKSSNPTIEYILVDKKLGTEKVISTGDYAFTALNTDAANRFDLRVQQIVSGVQQSSMVSGLDILSSPNGFLVKSNITGIGTIEVIDARGSRVNVLTDVSLVKGNNFFSPGLADGFYVVKVTTGNRNYIGGISIVK